MSELNWDCRLEEIDDPLELINTRIRVGHQARAFWSSDLGKQVFTRIKDEWGEARDALTDVDPDNSNEIRELQSTIKRAQSMIEWFSGLIADGMQAEADQYRELEDGE